MPSTSSLAISHALLSSIPPPHAPVCYVLCSLRRAHPHRIAGWGPQSDGVPDSRLQADLVFSYAMSWQLPSQAAEPYQCSKVGSCESLTCPASENVERMVPPGNTGAYIQQYCKAEFACGDGPVDGNKSWIPVEQIKKIIYNYGPLAIDVDARAWYDSFNIIFLIHFSVSYHRTRVAVCASQCPQRLLQIRCLPY